MQCARSPGIAFVHSSGLQAPFDIYSIVYSTYIYEDCVS